MKHDEYLLIEKAKTGNKAALTELVNMYSPQIYNLGLRMMRNKTDAEDILQDTFLVMVRKLNTFEGRSSLYTWLYRIAMNLCLEKLNDKHRTPITASIDDPDYEGMADFQAVLLPDFTEETLSDSQFRLYLEQALEDLNYKLKAVFILRDIEGISVSDTAKIMNLMESNVKVRLMRARLFLRERLTKIFKSEGWI